jgi:hypothetical protein
MYNFWLELVYITILLTRSVESLTGNSCTCATISWHFKNDNSISPYHHILYAYPIHAHRLSIHDSLHVALADQLIAVLASP